MTTQQAEKITTPLRWALCGLVAVVLMGSNSAAAAGKPTVNWRMQVLWEAGSTPYEYEKKFVQRVAQLTDGKFSIRVFGEGELVSATRAFDAVRKGTVEMMKTFDGYETGITPAFAFTSSVPFGFPHPDQYEAWFYERGGLEFARQAYASNGLFYIAPTIYGQEPLHANFPLHSLDDVKGKKGRFVGLASLVMYKFGVDVTPLPIGKVYPALANGVVDFADRGDLIANLEAGLGDVAKYVIVPGFHQPTTATSYVANQRAYNRLPSSYKAALEVAAREISAALRQRILAEDAAALRKFQEQGVEVIHLDPTVVARARPTAMAAWQEAAADDKLANQVLQSQIEFMKELGLLGQSRSDSQE
ncbi:TRAP transporter substrate-binding protein DctP [Marinobacter sp. X15-166B]|uniref:TRAP transporter substrate-binding protein DctP n=1 Tax=Marinobacter sp. X15-166B TaxID=1897620 RepID=UPI00085BFC4E|nr:TRAP transporter substrate-binding protein DctP [Marinobacter sp. X15-166B]OEY67590.1 C4-dicarboxylate ABC transporter substrate-binding protein [Marinobacter sp. X15-166B]